MESDNKSTDKIFKQLVLFTLAGAASFLFLRMMEIGEKKVSAYVDSKKSHQDNSFETSLNYLTNTDNFKGINTTISALKSLDSSELTDAQKRDLYIAMARIVERYCEGNDCREVTSSLILKYYHHGFELSHLPEDRKSINRKLATFLRDAGAGFCISEQLRVRPMRTRSRVPRNRLDSSILLTRIVAVVCEGYSKFCVFCKPKLSLETAPEFCKGNARCSLEFVK